MSVQSSAAEPLSATYRAYLASDHWRDLKQRAFALYGCQCTLCDAVPVDGHHLVYRNLHDVKPEEVIPLCRTCHESVHEAQDAGRLGSAYSSKPGKERLAALLTVFPPTERWKQTLGAARHREKPVPHMSRKARRKRRKAKNRAERTQVDKTSHPQPTTLRPARPSRKERRRRARMVITTMRAGTHMTAPSWARPQQTGR